MPEKDKPLAQTIRARLKESKDRRVQWEAWVATVERFVEGDHRTWWDDRGQMHKKHLQKNEIWRTINLFPGALNIRKARLTKNDPKWFVRASSGVTANQDDIDAANGYLQFVYRNQEWKDKTKNIIEMADKRGLVPVMVGWNEQEQHPTLRHYDPWDFYPDPTAADMSDAGWLTVSIPRSVEWLTRQGFNTSNLKTADMGKLAESGLKDDYLKERFGGQVPPGTVLLNMYFVVEGDKILMYKNVGDFMLDEPQELPYKTFDEFIDIYRSRSSEHFYTRPPCSDWIDPQKTINKVYSSIEGYIDMFLHGRWRRTDDSVTIPIGGAHGQVIEAALGEVEQFQLQPLPATVQQHFETAIRQFEQISGVNSESLGRISGGATTGVAIERLQAFDEQNSAPAADNLRTFMSRIGRKVLRVTAENLKVKTAIQIEKGIGEVQRIDIVGEKAGNIRSLSDAVKIKPFDNIEVEIVIGSAFSEIQKQNTVKELFQFWTPGENPVIDKIIIDNWTIGMQRDVVSDLENLKSADRLIAQGENQKIRRGEFVSVDLNENHDEHMEVHSQEAKRMKEIGDAEGLERVNRHIEEHQLMIEEQRTRQQTQGEQGTEIGGVASPQNVV